MSPPLLIASVVLNFGVAGSLGAAAQFWWRARQTALPPSSLDRRPTLGWLREFAGKLEDRGRLNARAGVCVAAAALCQAGSTAAFLLSRGLP
jgi:hypothetical protein